MEIERDRLFHLAHSRLAATLRHLQFYSHYAAGNGLEERDGALLVAGADRYPHPYINAAIRVQREADPAEMLHSARRFFSERGRRFVLWIAGDDDIDLEALAVKEGFTRRPPLEGTAEMVLHERPQLSDLSPNIDVRPIVDDDGAALFQFLVAGAYEETVPRHASISVLAESGALLSPGAAAFIAWLDGDPVATSMVLFDEEIAEVGFVGTKMSARGLGLGTLITAVAARYGFDHAPVVVLQASAMGEPLYRRMGFVELMRYRRYESPA